MTSPFAPRRLSSPARVELLRALVSRLARRDDGRPNVAVFDLDGTLMDNRPRVVAILKELGEEWREKNAAAAECCARAGVDDIVYGFIENLKRLGVADPALHEEGLAFWRARFFFDPHVRHDVEVPGASAFVRACWEAGATIVYLTGRDLPNMALGSFASLRDLGFPIGVVGTELVVKPTFEMPDTVFKQSVMPALSRLGRVVAAFDNESANSNLFLEGHPECASVFVDTQHAPDPPPLDERAPVIESFVLET